MAQEPGGTTDTLAQHTLAAWCQALEGPRATPAGGALALVTLAGAAALSGKLSRLLTHAVPRLAPNAGWFLAAADADSAAYRAATQDPTLRRRCLELQCEHLNRALDLLGPLQALAAQAPAELAADIAAGAHLARAAALGLLGNLNVNLAMWAIDADLEDLARHREALYDRLLNR